jgi:hypothetical protein
MSPWPRTLSELFARLANRDRVPPTPHGAPPYVPGWDAPAIPKTCRYCGASVAVADYAVHVIEHQARGDEVPKL